MASKYDKLIKDTDRIISEDISFSGVVENLKSAKKYLLDPNNIDICNSIKNSVNARIKDLGKKFADIDHV